MDALTLISWARKHGITPAALKELCMMSIDVTHGGKDESEALVQSRIRLEAAGKGMYLYRNNRGAGQLKNGSFIRWGLCNDSEKVGDRFKSGDLIGLEPVRITSEMVGSVIGRFKSVEVKASSWKFSGTAEELAQVAWAALVNAQGGSAVIVNAAGKL
jgi:hypothetical protein